MPAVRTLRRPTPMATVQGALALDLSPRLTPPLAVVPKPTIPPIAELDVVPVGTATRRQLEFWARRYGQAAAEVATGDRPATQVLRWSTPRVYDDLARRGLLLSRAAGRLAGSGRSSPNLARPQVCGVRISFVAGHAVEASFHVRYGERSRAIAARFEVLDDRWQCCALEFA
ncbi:MAG: Rv3235 family protein [Nocardioides sp.]